VVHGTGFVARLDGIDTAGLDPGQGIRAIAMAPVTAPPTKIATKLLSIGTEVPPAVRPRNTATSAARWNCRRGDTERACPGPALVRVVHPSNLVVQCEVDTSSAG
jgi:hypothetical protein